MNGTTSTIASQEGQLSAPAKTHSAKAYAAESASSGLAPTSIQRRGPRAQDVEIEILYCGVCHSDLHQVRERVARVYAHGLPLCAGTRDGGSRHPNGQRRQEIQRG